MNVSNLMLVFVALWWLAALLLPIWLAAKRVAGGLEYDAR